MDIYSFNERDYSAISLIYNEKCTRQRMDGRLLGRAGKFWKCTTFKLCCYAVLKGGKSLSREWSRVMGLLCNAAGLKVKVRLPENGLNKRDNLPLRRFLRIISRRRACMCRSRWVGNSAPPSLYTASHLNESVPNIRTTYHS